jgi:hypothetical protein
MRHFIHSILIFLFVLTGHTATAGNDKIKGEGPLKTETRAITSFDEINASYAVKLVLTQSDKYSLKIEADESWMKYVEVSQSGNVLSVGMQEGHDYDGNKNITIYISYVKLNTIVLTGATLVETTNQLTADKLKITSNGASKVSMNIHVKELDANSSGASHLIFRGTCDKATFVFSGASNLSASELQVTDASLECTGASKATVNVSGTLDAHASGASNIRYSGNPTVTKDINGVSSIKSTGS